MSRSSARSQNQPWLPAPAQDSHGPKKPPAVMSFQPSGMIWMASHARVGLVCEPVVGDELDARPVAELAQHRGGVLDEANGSVGVVLPAPHGDPRAARAGGGD
jgi:hypothetical protein